MQYHKCNNLLAGSGSRDPWDSGGWVSRKRWARLLMYRSGLNDEWAGMRASPPQLPRTRLPVQEWPAQVDVALGPKHTTPTLRIHVVHQFQRARQAVTPDAVVPALPTAFAVQAVAAKDTVCCWRSSWLRVRQRFSGTVVRAAVAGAIAAPLSWWHDARHAYQ